MENVMFNPDKRLFDVDYKNADNIAYLVAMLEQVWGVNRIYTLMGAAKAIRDNQENKQELH